MKNIGKNGMNKLYKQIAQKRGVSEKEVKEEMEYAIRLARNNPDPAIQAEFMKRFGNKTPTPEEFILALSKEIKH